MMRPLLATVLLILLSSCGEDTDLDTLVMINYAEEFTLRVGQTAISPDSATVQLIDIAHDSRCANGVDCLWEGEIAVALEGSHGGVILPMDIKHSPGQTERATPNFVRFQVELVAANPYPDIDENNGQIEIDDYRIILVLREQ
ncbi:MAG: hypothetical protein RIF33_09960 [Cyclobacteriaceae bacterium]